MSSVIPSTMDVFPECPGYGFSAQPQYLVRLNMRQGGFESVLRRWPRPLSTYVSVPFAQRSDVDVQDVLYFWHAMGGMATPFLIKDWVDFQSCRTGEIPGVGDQPLDAVVTIAGGTTYQLKKLYVVGSLQQEREITKPVGSSLRLFNGAGDEQTDFTVDENTGLVQVGGGFDGVAVSWCGDFLVPVRFDSQLSISVVDQEIQGCDFTLREKRVVLETDHFGGSP